MQNRALFGKWLLMGLMEHRFSIGPSICNSFLQMMLTYEKERSTEVHLLRTTEIKRFMMSEKALNLRQVANNR